MRTINFRRIRFEHLEPRLMMAVLPGDYDLNGTVQTNDHTTWRSNFANFGDALSGDGNDDGIVDAADYVVWRKNLGKTFADVPPDPPKTITVSVSGAASVAISWQSSAFTDSYTVQRSQPDVSDEYTTVGMNIVGTTFSDNSVAEGNIYEYQVLAQNSVGTSAPSQRASVTAGRANLTAFRPQQFHDPENPTNAPIYAPFAKHSVAEVNEVSSTLGPGIRINGDDDNMSGTPDRSESGNPIPLENDLIEVRVDRLPGQTLILETGGDLFLYYSYDKATPIPFQTATRTEPLDFAGNSVTVFVEWAFQAHGLDPLNLRDSTTLAVYDALNFHTFHSAVVAFGGNGQVPADPVLDPKNYGVFRTAIELYNEGYDIRMYDEENVGQFTIGTAFDEIVNSINRQGYTEVALFGFSQGGGAVYKVSAELEEASNPLDGRITELFTVTFTGYIDAVDHFGLGIETRRPRLSGFHLNQYQTVGGVHGGPMADPEDPDEELDRTAPGMIHTMMDDDMTVLDKLKQRLRQKVTR